ncbi:Golgin candidate 6 [Camellia lanceoleosa]|uniref:Golgin candidate 6 n=1 Tax=Camellia lanceoleosa TaxID=1840588 RepID=A0ACC0G252_9ERIC|nr:Golgin candidate 6 [Camellia lanceoleosa]
MDLMSGHKVFSVISLGTRIVYKGLLGLSLEMRILPQVKIEDRRTAIAELQFVVAESRAAQLAFGGFPVLLSVLKEEHDDVEMVRGALETLVSALTPIDQAKALKNDVQPTLMNTDLLSREAESISLLLSLLSEEDFYIRYYTQQLLTVFLTNSPNRLQEAILTIPRGITRLMDMLMDREVIRNEALLLLTYLTREAEYGQVQKLAIFDCLELLNNLICNNASNQVLLRETMDIDPLISILKLRGSSYCFNQQKIINLLSALETIGLLIMGGPEIDTGKDANRLTNKAVLVQKKVFDHLLMLGALRCIGDLIASHTKNLDPQVEPALNSILRIILRTSSMQEFVVADYKNPDGQAMLASILIPQPQPTIHALPEEDVNMSFGRSTCSRAASVLSHVLKDNMQCKERVSRIELEEPTPSLGAPKPLLHRVVKYLAFASCMKSDEGKPNASGNTYVQAIILKLLIIWHLDCPSAYSRPHLTYLLELVSNSTTTVCIRGLAMVILGECVIYNKSSDMGLTSYFLKFEEMQKSIIFSSAKLVEPWKPLTRSTAASMAEIEDVEENEASDLKNEDHPMLALMFDAQFVDFIKNLEVDIRESIADVYSHPKCNVAVVSAELQQKGWESDGDYVKQLKSFVEKQCSEITICRNATLAEDLAKIGRGGSSQPEHRSSGGSERVQLETLHRDLQEASQQLDTLKTEKTKIEFEASICRGCKGKAREEAQKESETELNDLLVCLRQEQSKVEKLSVRLLEFGEDVDKLLEGIGDDIGLLEDPEVEED